MNDKAIVDKLEDLEEQIHFYRQLGVDFLIRPENGLNDREKTSAGLISFETGPEEQAAIATEWEKLLRRINDCRFCPLFREEPGLFPEKETIRPG